MKEASKKKNPFGMKIWLRIGRYNIIMGALSWGL
jgi:hypothetical protein